MWLPDVGDISNYYSAVMKADGSIKSKVNSSTPYIRRMTCRLSKESDALLSQRYKRITLDDQNQVRLQYPRFKIHGKKHGISSINNLDRICEHYGLGKFVKASLVAEKRYFPKDVLLDDQRKFKTFQTDRRIPQIKEILCLRAPQ